MGEREGQRGAWRACFPWAKGANVGQSAGTDSLRNPYGRCTTVVDAYFVHLVGLRALNMSWCTQVTDAAFAHLQGIKSLDMSCCSQLTITDAALANLRGIHTLGLHDCTLYLNK